MKHADAPDDATVAAVFRAALSLGIATPADLVPWADAQILARERPAEWIIDLSIGEAARAETVIANLEHVARLADGEVIFRLLIGLIDEPSHWTFDRARAMVRWLREAARGPIHEKVDTLDTYFWLADELLYPNRLIVDAIDLIHAHADPAARAWLPGVRVRLD